MFEEHPVAVSVEVEMKKIAFNQHSRTAEGLAEGFTVMIPLIIKNSSDYKVRVRNMRPILDLPDGYQQHLFYDNLHSPEGRDIASKDFLPCTFGFAANTKGREGGVNEKNPAYVANRDKILSEIASSKIIFRFSAEVVSVENKTTIEEISDLTSVLLPQIKIEK
jgi:hypothetical protein